MIFNQINNVNGVVIKTNCSRAADHVIRLGSVIIHHLVQRRFATSGSGFVLACSLSSTVLPSPGGKADLIWRSRHSEPKTHLAEGGKIAGYAEPAWAGARNGGYVGAPTEGPELSSRPLPHNTMEYLSTNDMQHSARRTRWTQPRTMDRTGIRTKLDVNKDTIHARRRRKTVDHHLQHNPMQDGKEEPSLH